MEPAFRITVDGADITAKINDRLLRLSITDEPGVDSDMIEVEVDNRDKVLQAPRKGAKIRAWLGYVETGVELMGEWVVDEVTGEVPPWTLGFMGRAADLRETFKEQKSRHFENTTVGDVVQRIAKDHGLQAAVGSDIASQKIEYFLQSEESDLHFLTRFARRHGAIAKPTNGKLVFVKRGSGKSGSGVGLGSISLRPSDTTKARARLADRPRHAQVEAQWHDRKKAERVPEVIGSGQGPKMILPHIYPTKDEAKKAAETRSRELSRAEGSLSVEMPGNTGIFAEMTVKMIDYDDVITGSWNIARAEHVLDGNGYQTMFEGDKGEGESQG